MWFIPMNVVLGSISGSIIGYITTISILQSYSCTNLNRYAASLPPLIVSIAVRNDLDLRIVAEVNYWKLAN